jgi:hypothetical protein
MTKKAKPKLKILDAKQGTDSDGNSCSEITIGIPIECIDVKKLKTIHGLCDGNCKDCSDLKCRGRDT